MIKFFGVLMSAVVGVTAVASIAVAETVTFEIRSLDKKTVHLEFYSQYRDHVWPGNGQVYVLDDYNYHTYRLSCVSGEKICYGAWIKNKSNTYWGVGRDDQNSCKSCCLICDGGKQTYTLND